MIAGICIAAGLSRRMGHVNKLLIKKDQSPLFLHPLQQMLHSNIDLVILVVGHEEELLRPHLQGMPITIVYNPTFALGMTSSIQTGIRALPEKTEAIIIQPSDQPWVQAETFDRLIQTYRSLDNQQPIIRSKNAFVSHPTLFAAKYANDLLSVTESNGCKSVIESHSQDVIVQEVLESLIDIDTPEDVERWQAN